MGHYLYRPLPDLRRRRAMVPRKLRLLQRTLLPAEFILRIVPTNPAALAERQLELLATGQIQLTFANALLHLTTLPLPTG